MSDKKVEDLDRNSKAELICVYASLLLHDEKLEVSADHLKKLIETSGNGKNVDSFWPSLFAKSLKGKKIDDFLGGGSAPAGGAAQSASAPVQAKVEAKVVEKEAPKEEEEDVDMGGLFDF
jgi:large subunit ribosomal protein LP1